MTQEQLKPENHQYTTHPTYTGVGCAHCGKSEQEHVKE